MKYLFVVMSLIATMVSVIIAQQGQKMPQGRIAGTIVYSIERKPVEYANVILFSQKDSTQITGTTSDSDGYFHLEGLRPGRYYCEILFIGYHARTIDNIRIGIDNLSVDLGEILLEEETLSMDAVEVEAERVPIQYQIDKKIISVAGQPTAISGTAVDVLENVPSVTVDIEGNVSLRGSSNFTVLVDGRPSVLESDEILHQIPASSIENIEIITNPSAKYNPEGSAGIINIIMKKNKQTGKNGIVNLDAGLENKQGIDFLLNFSDEKYRFSFGADYNNRYYPGNMERELTTSYNGVERYIFSDGSSSRERNSYGVKGSFGYQIDHNDMIDFGAQYGNRSHQRNSNVNFEEWIDPEVIHTLYFSKDNSKRSGDFYSFNLNYLHNFRQKEHQLKSELSMRHRESVDKTLNELHDINGVINEGQRFNESGPSDNYEFKIDYVLPINEKYKFEAGAKSDMDISKDETARYQYNAEIDDYEYQSDFSHLIKYDNFIHAIYSIYSGEWEKLGYQAGFRAELTDRSIRLEQTGENFTLDRWDYFPSFHVSYQFTKGQQLMASYTRRIMRPRGWALEPFETWMDAYTVRKGNPSLKPEYVDSYEAGFQLFMGKNVISTEMYYRVTDNRIERIQSVYAENITLHTTDNIGKDYSFGTELMINADLSRWWNLNLMGNLYDFKIEGQLDEENFTRQSFNWNTRINNSIKITKTTRLQLNGIYNSKSVSSQGKREGFFITNAAVRQEFLNRQLSATLQINDILKTGKFEFTSKGTDFYSYNHFTREAPVIMLNLSYNLNNYKTDRKRNNNNDQDNMEDDGEF